MEQLLAMVAVENVAYHFDIFYSYTFDKDLKEQILPGMRVLVPFGKGKNVKRQGVVFSVEPCEDASPYKGIISALDEKPVITAEMLEIAAFLKNRTFCTYFEEYAEYIERQKWYDGLGDEGGYKISKLNEDILEVISLYCSKTQTQHKCQNESSCNTHYRRHVYIHKWLYSLCC